MKQHISSINRIPTEYIRVLDNTSPQYAKLKEVADRLNKLAPTGVRYLIYDVMFDMGQNWLWTTILQHEDSDDDDHVQILTPRDQHDILFGSEGQKEAIIEKIIGKISVHYLSNKDCADYIAMNRLSEICENKSKSNDENCENGCNECAIQKAFATIRNKVRNN